MLTLCSCCPSVVRCMSFSRCWNNSCAHPLQVSVVGGLHVQEEGRQQGRAGDYRPSAHAGIVETIFGTPTFFRSGHLLRVSSVPCNR